MKDPARKHNNQTLAFNYSLGTDSSRDVLLHTHKRKGWGGGGGLQNPLLWQKHTRNLHKYMIQIMMRI
jgi:hypothetical protein